MKARLTVAHEVLKNFRDFDDKAGAAKEVIIALNTEIGTHQRTQALLSRWRRFLCATNCAKPPKRAAAIDGEISAARHLASG